ncbi:hypothetical protein GCM10022221_13470 [Actinocorallia aurea]
MRPSVQEAFLPFTTKFEGRVPIMYVDVKGLVTTGVGNLIDPVGLALELPFAHKGDGSPASAGEITAEWESLKADRESLAVQGWRACVDRTDLELSDADIDVLVQEKAAQFEQTLKSLTPEFAGFDDWPADAQLGLMSMAWALGPAFATGGRWPSFRAAVAAADWTTAAAQCHMNDQGNPGLKPRNDADLHLFTNAALVIDLSLDPDNLLFT